jgi:hypothetical protein
VQRACMIVLMMLAVGGCTSGSGPTTTAPTVDVTGTWVGTWASNPPGHGAGRWEMTLTQTESRVSGTVALTGIGSFLSGVAEGVVSGNELRLLEPPHLTGELTVQGDRMAGRLHGAVPADIDLRRQK